MKRLAVGDPNRSDTLLERITARSAASMRIGKGEGVYLALLASKDWKLARKPSASTPRGCPRGSCAFGSSPTADST